MNKAIKNGGRRLAVYFERAIRALDSGKMDQAMADLAELAFIANRLWEDIAKEEEKKYGDSP